jgi:hypothetical protein
MKANITQTAATGDSKASMMVDEETAGQQVHDR